MEERTKTLPSPRREAWEGETRDTLPQVKQRTGMIIFAAAAGIGGSGEGLGEGMGFEGVWTLDQGQVGKIYRLPSSQNSSFQISIYQNFILICYTVPTSNYFSCATILTFRIHVASIFPFPYL